MKTRSKLPFFLSILAISGFCVLFSGCEKIIVTFPNTPVITYQSATVTKTLDSGIVDYQLKVIISFTDGNGNIGLSASDTTGTFRPASPYYYNLWVGYYEDVKDSFIHITQSFPFTGGDTINYNGRIPVITPTGKLKAITGTIEYDIDLGSGTKSGASEIKFDFILLDKALNKSNKVTSLPIVLP